MPSVEDMCFEAAQRVQEAWLADLLAQAGDEITKLKKRLEAETSDDLIQKIKMHL